MGRINKDIPFNLNILKQCREQLGFSIDSVKKKVPLIDKIEDEGKRPTYKQLDTLAELYEVPRWVFISTTLPAEYSYQQKPAFRTLSTSSVFDDTRVRKLTARIEHYRDLLLELRDDLADSILPFSGVNISNRTPHEAADVVRAWLALEKPLSLDELKQKLEKKKHLCISYE